jgi:hypothetical protein
MAQTSCDATQRDTVHMGQEFIREFDESSCRRGGRYVESAVFEMRKKDSFDVSVSSDDDVKPVTITLIDASGRTRPASQGRYFSSVEPGIYRLEVSGEKKGEFVVKLSCMALTARCHDFSNYAFSLPDPRGSGWTEIDEHEYVRDGSLPAPAGILRRWIKAQSEPAASEWFLAVLEVDCMRKRSRAVANHRVVSDSQHGFVDAQFLDAGPVPSEWESFTSHPAAAKICASR